MISVIKRFINNVWWFLVPWCKEQKLYLDVTVDHCEVIYNGRAITEYRFSMEDADGNIVVSDKCIAIAPNKHTVKRFEKVLDIQPKDIDITKFIQLSNGNVIILYVLKNRYNNNRLNTYMYVVMDNDGKFIKYPALYHFGKIRNHNSCRMTHEESHDRVLIAWQDDDIYGYLIISNTGYVIKNTLIGENISGECLDIDINSSYQIMILTLVGKNNPSSKRYLKTYLVDIDIT